MIDKPWNLIWICFSNFRFVNYFLNIAICQNNSPIFLTASSSNNNNIFFYIS